MWNHVHKNFLKDLLSEKVWFLLSEKVWFSLIYLAKNIYGALGQYFPSLLGMNTTGEEIEGFDLNKPSVSR